MKIDLKQLEILYFQNDLEVPYILKDKTELKINPIKVKDWSIFESCEPILKINKNRFDSIEILQMSYLNFLVEHVLSEKENMNKLIMIFSLCLKESRIVAKLSAKVAHLEILDDYGNVKHRIEKKDFDNIIKIILNQNTFNYDDVELSEDIQKSLELYYATLGNQGESPKLERQKTYVMSKNGMTMKTINDMSYRSFSLMYRAMLDNDLYMAKNILKSGYSCTIDGEVRHPLFEKELTPTERMVKSAFVDSSSVKNKLDKAGVKTV